MHDDNLLNRINSSSSKQKHQQNQRNKQITATTSQQVTATTCKHKEKKVENVDDLIHACLNQNKKFLIAKEWSPEISNNQNKPELSDISNRVCSQKLKSGENLPIYFSENGLNFVVNITGCDSFSYNNDLMANFVGRACLNRTNYQIEGQIVVNQLHGEAKLVELKNDDKTKKSSYHSSDDANTSIPSIKTEKLSHSPNAVAPDDSDDALHAIETAPETPAAVAAASSTSNTVHWSKKAHLLKKYQEN